MISCVFYVKQDRKVHAVFCQFAGKYLGKKDWYNAGMQAVARYKVASILKVVYSFDMISLHILRQGCSQFATIRHRSKTGHEQNAGVHEEKGCDFLSFKKLNL